MSSNTYNLPWTESPLFAAQLQESILCDSDKAFVKFFADNGYVIFDPQIDETAIENVKLALAPEFRKQFEQGEGQRVQDAWKFNDDVKKIAASENVMSRLRLLYQREPIPFQTLNFPVSTEQATHSDMVHFNSIPQRFMCGVWTALEDITIDQGPLHYYPGSHKLPFYDMIDLGVKASDNIETKKALMVYANEYTHFIREMIIALGLKKQILTIKKGHALIWSANLLHGAEKINLQGSTRHSQVSHYYFSDCLYYVPRFSDIAINRLFLSDLVNIKTNEKVVNKYFGSEIKPAAKLQLQQGTVRMLSKVAHLFPKEVVNKVKAVVLG